MQSLPIIIKNAYIWKYIHTCISDFSKHLPGILVLKFEDMHDYGIKILNDFIKQQYGFELNLDSNIFASFSQDTDGILTDCEIAQISDIVADTAKNFYQDF